MKSRIFEFGTNMDEYPIPVVNEREIRAGAGIMFVLAFLAFMNAYLLGDFFYIKLVVIAFLIEFFIRVVINPKYAPFLVLGRIITLNQIPDFSGAPQKKFAWIIGLVLATIMFYLIVIMGIVGIINLAICFLCLTLLFFESAFGICIGCWLYNMVNKEKSKLCPGGACELPVKYKVQELNLSHYLTTTIIIVFMVIISFPLANSHTKKVSINNQTNRENIDNCIVPKFAKLIGHEEKWRLHNNCQ